MSEGRALTNCIGNVVATLAIARWNGELDRERLAAVLDDPSLVDEAMEREHGGKQEGAAMPDALPKQRVGLDKDTRPGDRALV